MSEPRHMLISGASRGLGQALAQHYLDRGDLVAGCSRGPATIDHPNYLHVAADVTDAKAVHDLFAQVRKQWGTLDVLINNAGVGKMLPIALTPSTLARQLMEINFMGTFLLTNEALRLLRKSTAPRIINMTSVAVPLRLDGEAVYAAAKSAIETFTRIAAKEFGGFGITCNAIGPSPIRTDLIRNVPEDKLQVLIGRQAIPDWATKEDLIHLVDFLVHPSSRMITGQVIYLGGIS